MRTKRYNYFLLLTISYNTAVVNVKSGCNMLLCHAIEARTILSRRSCVALYGCRIIGPDKHFLVFYRKHNRIFL